MVDLLIKQKDIHVNKFYSGPHFDLINDTVNKQIWFFILQHQTLQYKIIPYDELFQVNYKLDGHTIKTASRSGKLKRELIGGKVYDNSTSSPAMWKKSNDFRMAKEVRLTILIDDIQATTLDLVFHTSHLPVDLKYIKDEEAKDWFNVFTHIIEKEERKQA